MRDASAAGGARARSGADRREVPASVRHGAAPAATGTCAWPGGSSAILVVVALLRRSSLWQLNPRAAAAQHHRQRRRHGRPRLVPGVPAGPPAALVAGRRLVARLVRRLPGRPVLLPGPGAARRARSTSSCRTTSRSSSSPRSARCCSRPARTSSAGACGCGARVPSSSRSATTLFLFFKGVARDAGQPRRDDPVQPADHGRPDRQHAGGGVLVHARARVRRSRSSARSRSRCARGAGCGSPRCSSPRRCCATSSSASSSSSARSSSGCSTGRCARFPVAAAIGGGRRAAHRVLDRPAARDLRLHGEHAVREAHLVPRLPLPDRVLVGRRARRDRRASSGSSAATARCSRSLTLTRRLRGRVPALARAARVEPALPAVLVPRAVPARRGRRRPRSCAGASQQVALVWLGPAARRRTRTGELDPVVDGRRFRLVKSVTRRRAGGAARRRRRSGSRTRDRGFLDFWAEWNYSGYEDTSPSSTKPKPYGEYRDADRHDGPAAHRAARCGRAARRSTRTARRSR